MSTSAVQICNMALSRIGSSAYIESLSENSEEAIACNLVYEFLRDTVLRDYPWNFAKRYANLSLVEEEPVQGWEYSYRYPSDCIRIRAIINDVRQDNETSPIPYEIGSDDTGLLIYTDEPTPVCKYTKRITNPGYFPPDFADAFAWKIASDIALPRSRIKGMAQTAMQMYQLALEIAEANDGNENQLAAMAESEFIRARD